MIRDRSGSLIRCESFDCGSYSGDPEWRGASGKIQGLTSTMCHYEIKANRDTKSRLRYLARLPRIPYCYPIDISATKLIPLTIFFKMANEAAVHLTWTKIIHKHVKIGNFSQILSARIECTTNMQAFNGCPKRKIGSKPFVLNLPTTCKALPETYPP